MFDTLAATTAYDMSPLFDTVTRKSIAGGQSFPATLSHSSDEPAITGELPEEPATAVLDLDGVARYSQVTSGRFARDVKRGGTAGRKARPRTRQPTTRPVRRSE